MNRADEREALVSHLWQEHMRAPFPAGLAGAERAGIDLVLLDADIAGCVSSWRNNGGSLDGERHRILHRRVTDLDRILPLLGAAEDPPYWRRLHQLARLASEAGPRPAK
ncbi:hypothetical protein [Streptomyces sp. NRRL_B-2249]|uniref:hypothetical protein n=1 Tax=Streptomyces sp. NRRL_B-2249 TaxID=3028697 RepID=UPI000998781D|nr:hypothetical protein [Streptomyces sp. NRRL_B-2249]